MGDIQSWSDLEIVIAVGLSMLIVGCAATFAFCLWSLSEYMRGRI